MFNPSKDNPTENNAQYLWKSFRPASKPTGSLGHADHVGETLQYDPIRKQCHFGTLLPQQPVSVSAEPTQESTESVVYKL